jgi:Flp pilus assembly pilin Flp
MYLILRRLSREEEAQDLTEYALLLVLIALASIGVAGLASTIAAVWSNAAKGLLNAT